MTSITAGVLLVFLRGPTTHRLFSYTRKTMIIYSIGYEDDTLTSHLVVKYILQKQVTQAESNSFVEISNSEFKSIHRKAHKTLKRLVSDGLIECDGLYLASNITDNPKSLSYRFTETGLSELKLLELNPNDYHTLAWRSFAGKVSQNPKNNSKDSDIVSSLFEYVKSCSLDIGDIINSNLNIQQCIIPLQLVNHSPFITRSDTEYRIHSSFSLLPSNIKSNVRVSNGTDGGSGGSYLIELDICSSNPFLLSFHILSVLYSCSSFSSSPHSLCISSLMTNGFTRDTKNFINGCLTGHIYNLLADTLQPHYKKKKLDRDDGKKWMMFLMNEHTESLERYEHYHIIKDTFPTITNVIEALKEECPMRLGVYLMREESKMMIDTIAKDLLNYDIPFLTAHDAIWTPPQYGSAVRSKMKEHYIQKYGVAPNIKINK